MTPEELAAIRERANAATQGPWQKIQPGGPNGPFWGICNPKGNIIALRLSQSTQDADFIAAAREDIPALLAEVDRLRELCQQSLHALLFAGDALNWPDDVEDVIAGLRKALRR